MENVILFVNICLICKDSFDKKFKILVYIDSSKCVDCNLQFNRWVELLDGLDSVSRRDISLLFFVHMKDSKRMKYFLDYGKFTFPVIVDTINEFGKLNNLSDTSMFNTFLLDHNNRILLVGSPLANSKVRSLYYNVILIVLFCFLLFACEQREVIHLPETELKVIYSFEELSDSSLFSDVRAMRWDDNCLAFTDYYRSQLILCSDSGQVINVMSRKGKGPGEMLAAASFWKNGDSYYVFDEGKRTINIFTKNGYEKSIAIEAMGVALNYAFEDDVLWGANYNEKGAITNYSIKDSLIAYMGQTFSFKTPRQNMIRNNRYVWKYNDYLFTVSDNIPVMELFDLNNRRCVNHYDYSDLDFYDKNQRYIDSQPFDENSYQVIVANVYGTKDRLYLLCSDWSSGKYLLNQILVFALDGKEISPVHIYKLKGKYYYSFCVDENNHRLFAANRQTSMIDVFQLPE